MDRWYHSSFKHGQCVKRSGGFSDREFDINDYDDYAYKAYVKCQPWTYVGCPHDDDDRDSDDYDMQWQRRPTR